jgi:hypothetical protein
VSAHFHSASYAYPTNLLVWMSSRRLKLVHETRLKYHMEGTVPQCRSRGWYSSTASRRGRTPWIGSIFLEYLLYVSSPNLVKLGGLGWLPFVWGPQPCGLVRYIIILPLRGAQPQLQVDHRCRGGGRVVRSLLRTPNLARRGFFNSLKVNIFYAATFAGQLRRQRR